MANEWGDRVRSRFRELIDSQRGLPFEKATIDFNWHGRGNFTRGYAHSVTSFAMQAFHTEDRVAVANDALQELCRHYLDHPHDLHESHSFHWSGALYQRLWAFFGPAGTVAANRMDETTQPLMLDMMSGWSAKASIDLRQDAGEDRIWRIPNSENHHAMGVVTTWAFSGILARERSDGAYDDGRSPADHHADWTSYLKAYFRARAGKGQSVEIASKNYNAHTIQMWYNVFDFAEDDALKEMAGRFLDLYWATWAEEQIDGVRGGGKTRIYQGPASKSAAGGAVDEMAALYLGDRAPEKMGTQDWVVATSRYLLSDVVRALAAGTEGRGCYEVVQRCMGLQEPGWDRVPNPPVVPFGVSALRADFGGFLRYSYCTPDYVMGTLMLEPRHFDEWSGPAQQNRWQGVMFSGHPDAAIVPEVLAVDTHLNTLGHSTTHNQHWSLQKKGTLITQKLETDRFSLRTGPSRVWVSRRGLTDPVETEGWVFVEAASAHAGIWVHGGYSWDDEEDGGRWLRCRNDLAAIVIEVGRSSEHAREAFREALTGRTPQVAEGVLQYTGLSGDRLRFYTDFSALPQANGEPVNLAPSKVYDSPFVQSEWDSGIVTLSYGDRTEVLDFSGGASS